MAVFTDRNKHQLTVNLTVGAIRKVRSETGIDLGSSLTDEKALASLMFGSPDRLVSILYVLTGSTADPDEFADAFDGPTLERATDALLQAIADFFPRSRIAAAIREKMSEMLNEMDQNILDQINRPSKGSVGS